MTTRNDMTRIEAEAVSRVLAAAREDLVSYAEFKQILRDIEVEYSSFCINMRNVFSALLESGIAVGRAVNDEGDHVKFVAWSGSKDEKIQRLSMELERLGEQDSRFGCWLCLAENVDVYEATEPGTPIGPEERGQGNGVS